MTRDELIEKMARAIYEDRNGFGCRKFGVISLASQKPYRSDATAALAAIEAAGLCIVPVDATDAIEDAMLDTGLVEDGIPRKSASDCAQTVYRAALDAGKL